MRIPKEIVSKKNKLRDLDICLKYISGMTPDQISDELASRNAKLTPRRIEQIVYENSAFVNPRIAWPKSKRLHLRQRMIQRTLDGNPISKKDVVDQLDSLREEIEGDKPLIDNSTHLHLTVAQLAKEINGQSAGGAEEALPAALPRAGFVFPKDIGE